MTDAKRRGQSPGPKLARGSLAWRVSSLAPTRFSFFLPSHHPRARCDAMYRACKVLFPSLLGRSVALRHSSTWMASNSKVKIVEVSPRDGLQNEQSQVSAATKVELIHRLQDAGAQCIESGALVSPRWVPQMKDTVQVLENIRPKVGVSYPILVPNERGFLRLQEVLAESGETPGFKALDEIAIFTAASQTFCQKNTNCTIEESLDRLAIVTRKALEAGLKVRGYISVVAVCPFEGKVSPKKVKEISDKLLEMGCYEVSLGDTVGSASPSMMLDVLDACVATSPVDKFAAHCHDTMGTGLANVIAMVNAGVRTVDSAVGGLGGCPYSPGATGNIDSESVIFALEKEGYSTGLNLEMMAKTGQWISEQLNRPNNSSAGRAILSRLQRERQEQDSSENGPQSRL